MLKASIFDSIIKERAGVTDEQLGGIRDTLEATSAALTHKVGNSFIERFKEDASINHLDFETTGALASLGVHIARPTDGKTVSDYRAGIGSRVTIRGLDSVSDVAVELAVMWADL